MRPLDAPTKSKRNCLRPFAVYTTAHTHLVCTPLPTTHLVCTPLLTPFGAHTTAHTHLPCTPLRMPIWCTHHCPHLFSMYTMATAYTPFGVYTMATAYTPFGVCTMATAYTLICCLHHGHCLHPHLAHTPPFGVCTTAPRAVSRQIMCGTASGSAFKKSSSIQREGRSIRFPSLVCTHVACSVTVE